MVPGVRVASSRVVAAADPPQSVAVLSLRPARGACLRQRQYVLYVKSNALPAATAGHEHGDGGA